MSFSITVEAMPREDKRFTYIYIYIKQCFFVICIPSPELVEQLVCLLAFYTLLPTTLREPIGRYFLFCTFYSKHYVDALQLLELSLPYLHRPFHGPYSRTFVISQQMVIFYLFSQ